MVVEADAQAAAVPSRRAFAAQVRRQGSGFFSGPLAPGRAAATAPPPASRRPPNAGLPGPAPLAGPPTEPHAHQQRLQQAAEQQVKLNTRDVHRSLSYCFVLNMLQTQFRHITIR